MVALVRFVPLLVVGSRCRLQKRGGAPVRWSRRASPTVASIVALQPSQPAVTSANALGAIESSVIMIYYAHSPFVR